MQYKTGDTVWYVDIISNPPRIRQDVVKNRSGEIRGEQYYSVISNEGKESFEKKYFFEYQLFPTKEVLLAVIDPPLHNFAVGQTVWFVNNLVDRLCVQKGVFCDCEDEVVTVQIGSDYAVQTFTHLKYIFDNPQDAVQKALELKQW